MELDYALIRAYLLGNLPPEARQEVEERYFADDDYFEAVAACEDEIFRDYAGGDLTERERQSVDAKYLSTADGRERLRFATGLFLAAGRLRDSTANADANRAGPLRALWLWMNAHRSGVLLAVAATLVLGFVADLEFVVRRMGAGHAKPAGGAGPANSAARTAAPVLPPFRLLPDVLRGSRSAIQPILLPAPQSDDLMTVRLHLDLEPGQRVERYRAVLSASAAKEVWSGTVVRGAADDFVEAGVPAIVLAPGDYILSLDADPAGQAHESYVFRVERSH